MHLILLHRTQVLRGCLKSPILCHAEGSVSPPDDLRYAKRVLSISVYVQNLDSIALRAYAPQTFQFLRFSIDYTQNDNLYLVRLSKHPLRELSIKSNVINKQINALVQDTSSLSHHLC
jgi:hypothetical protein